MSSPEPSAFDSSTSETEPSSCADPAATVHPSRPGGNTPLAPTEQSIFPSQNRQEQETSVGEGRDVSASVPRQQLCEAKETLAMMAEELAAAELAAHEQAAKRVAAEDRVNDLQVSQEGTLSVGG